MIEKVRAFIDGVVQIGTTPDKILVQSGQNRASIIRQGFTAERLLTGEADLAVQQISELKLIAGIEVVGPIPLHLHSPAVFSAGCMAASGNADQADRLLKFLASPEAAPALRESGLEPF